MSGFYNINIDDIAYSVYDSNNYQVPSRDDGLFYFTKNSTYHIKIENQQDVTAENVFCCKEVEVSITNDYKTAYLGEDLVVDLCEEEEKIVKFTPTSTKAYDFTISESLSFKLYNEDKFLLNEEIGRCNALLEKDCSYYFVVSGNDEINSCTINI